MPEKRDGRYVFTVTDEDGNEELVECPPDFGRWRAEVHRQKTRQYLERLGDVEMEGKRRRASGNLLVVAVVVALLLILLW